MSDLITRRGYLLATIQAAPGEWTTARAEQALSVSPFSCHRNSARKSLRSLAREGHLATGITAEGRRVYCPTDRSAV